jgi:hypothetical protein
VDDRAPADGEPRTRRRDWNAVSAIVASLIGILALSVSGYTAYVQRQQVRAQVWPYLILSNYDNDRALIVLNKGVGPAIMRSARVRVDGKPQAHWTDVLNALGIADPRPFYVSTITVNVLSPGERVPIISFEDEKVYRAFRDAALPRLRTDLCYCSTLSECWAYSDNIFGNAPTITPLAECPKIPESEAFRD